MGLGKMFLSAAAHNTIAGEILEALEKGCPANLNNQDFVGTLVDKITPGVAQSLDNQVTKKGPHIKNAVWTLFHAKMAIGALQNANVNSKAIQASMGCILTHYTPDAPSGLRAVVGGAAELIAAQRTDQGKIFNIDQAHAINSYAKHLEDYGNRVGPGDSSSTSMIMAARHFLSASQAYESFALKQPGIDSAKAARRIAAAYGVALSPLAKPFVNQKNEEKPAGP